MDLDMDLLNIEGSDSETERNEKNTKIKKNGKKKGEKKRKRFFKKKFVYEYNPKGNIIIVL
jgi:hypothetical protein